MCSIYLIFCGKESKNNESYAFLTIYILETVNSGYHQDIVAYMIKNTNNSTYTH